MGGLGEIVEVHEAEDGAVWGVLVRLWEGFMER